MNQEQTRYPQCNHPQLSHFLSLRFGPDRPQSWWAQQTFVSQVAVSSWLTGKCRPTPDRLGLIAAILGLSEDEVNELARLAEYDEEHIDQYEKMLAAYHKWCSQRQQRRLALLVNHDDLDAWVESLVIQLKEIVSDVEVRKAIAGKHPDFIQFVIEGLA